MSAEGEDDPRSPPDRPRTRGREGEHEAVNHDVAPMLGAYGTAPRKTIQMKA